MNTGQTLFVLAAFALLSTLTLDVNASLITMTTTGLEMETSLDALSVGQSLMDEILSKEFDEKTTGGTRAFSYDDVTPLGGFGPDGGAEAIVGNGGIDSSRSGKFQSKTRFDDVDDYHRYQRTSWDPRMGWFHVSVAVCYVSEDAPYTVALSPTFCKKITVTIDHPNLSKDANGQIVPVVMSDLSVYRRYF